MTDRPNEPGSGLRDQFEHYRQQVMDSEAVRTMTERISTQGPDLVERVKGLASEAMVRRISIQQEGRTIFEFPLAVGVGGALIAPQLAALGALAALITNCTIAVEREDTHGGTGPSGPSEGASNSNRIPVDTSSGTSTGSPGSGSSTSSGSHGTSTGSSGSAGTSSTTNL
jgi:hypothetical protein